MLKKVLLIDDDPDLGRLVEMVLRPIEIIYISPIRVEKACVELTNYTPTLLFSM